MNAIMEQSTVRIPAAPTAPAWPALIEPRPAPAPAGGEALRLGVVLAGGCLLGGLKASTQGFHLFQIAALCALGFVLRAGWKAALSRPRPRDLAVAFLFAAAASFGAALAALIGLRTLDAAAPGLVSLRSYILAGQTCLFAPLLFALGLLAGRCGVAKTHSVC